MKQGYAISLAVVGIAACVAVFAVNELGRPTELYEAFTQQDSDFIKYVNEYGKSYGTKEEFAFRSEQFKNNLGAMLMHNSMNGISYQLGLNQFADWTPAEYKRLLGYKKSEATNVEFLDTSSNGAIDWRTKGAVNPVKNQ